MKPRRKGIIHAGGTVLRAVELDFATEHFLARKRARGLALNSLRAYGFDLADLQGYLVGHGITLLGLVAERHVEGWMDDMAARGLCPRSIARRLACVRQLFAHALTEAWITHDPTANSHIAFRSERVIAPEAGDIVRMIDAIAPIGWHAVRDRALLSLMFDCALRVGEVAALDMPREGAAHSIDLVRQVVHVPEKGGGTGTVGIGDTTAKRLREWLDLRTKSIGEFADSPALFISNRRERFSRQGLALLVTRRGNAVGVKLTTHMLRHRRVGDMVERMGLDVARGMARHRHTSTTANVYGAHAAQVIHQRIREAGDPLAGRVVA